MKMTKLLSMLMLTLALYTSASFADSIPTPDPVTSNVLPADPIGDPLMDSPISAMMVSFMVFTLMIIPVSDYLNKMTIKANGKGAQIFSLVVAIILGYVGHYAKLGMFADMGMGYTALVSLGAGLSANAIFPTPAIQWVLQIIKSRNKEGKF